ncbi:MAG: tryptophan--tRNA ligase [Spirochaetia bacterium]
MSNEKKIVLTGIKPTGEPHLGNYFGAIKPAIELSQRFEARYFIADYHAINGLKDARLLKDYTYCVAAAWLACGLDASQVTFYRQSDVPEIFELMVFLSSFTAKGLMNRAHAYKARVDENEEEGNPPDHQINMGLYTYPILMAADILLFDTHLVPVGKDQKQHIEMAQDIAQAVNHCYGEPIFEIPQPYIQETQQVVTGLDGRKMSKSYQNVIPLFCSSKQLKKLVNSIVTNSQTLEEPKDPTHCPVFALYKLFATPDQQESLAACYRAGGMGWGHAKAALYDVIEEALASFRARYETLIAKPDHIHDLLQKGAKSIRVVAQAKMAMIREKIGLGHG